MEYIYANEEMVTKLDRPDEIPIHVAIDRERGWVYVLSVSASLWTPPVALYCVPLAMNSRKWTSLLEKMECFCQWPPGVVGMCTSYMGYSIDNVDRKELKMDKKCLDDQYFFVSSLRSVTVHPPSGDLLLCFTVSHKERTPFARIRVSSGELWLVEKKDGGVIQSCSVAKDGSGRLLSVDESSELRFFDDTRQVDMVKMDNLHIPPLCSHLVCASLDDEKQPPDGCYTIPEVSAHKEGRPGVHIGGRIVDFLWRTERTRDKPDTGFPPITLPDWASHAHVVGHDGKNGWLVHLTQEGSTKSKMIPVHSNGSDVFEMGIEIHQHKKAALVKVEWHSDVTTSVTPVLDLPPTVPITGLCLSNDWAFWIVGNIGLFVISLHGL